MHLKKLEIYGFKSFPDRTVMSFHSGITGVVGPNGSGKSNIADAVRWVLGEQSAKMLRGAKMEDVIFAGTDKRKPLGFCEVALTFDNQSGDLPVSFAEVTVARRVFRSGESEYQLNRTPCRLKDIVELFRDTGIGKEGYSLVGQGRIDEILSTRSEDRRRVFEEAAGIVKYMARRDEAEGRLAATAANVERVDDLLRELEGQIAPLAQAAEVARRYEKVRDELRGLELAAFVEHYDRMTDRIGQYEGQLSALQKRLIDLEDARASALHRREECAAALTQKEEEAAVARETHLAITRKAQTLQGARDLAAERAAAGSRDAERAAQDEAQAQTRFAALTQESGAGEALVQSRAIALAELKDQDDRSAAALLAELQKHDALEEELEQAKARRIEAMNRASNLRTAHARFTAMREGIERRMAQVAELSHKAGALLPDAQARAREAGAEAERAHSMLAGVREALTAAQKRSEDGAARMEELRALQQRLEGARRDTASRLGVLREMARDYEGYAQSVRAVMQEAKRRGMPGVHDVVASLLTVPKELERALEMSLGGQMQNIVVEREEDAQAMIEHLRANRLGRATFLPISAMRPRLLSREERAALSMPGCIGVASELISFDPRYRGVVDSLLARTVIARDLPSGIAIQRRGGHAFRLVTLEGDVMHSGGSMTGGSLQSRVTSLLAREREIAEHQDALAACEDKLAEAAAELHRAVQERASVKGELAELYEQERQQDIAVARDQERLHKAQDALADAQRQVTELGQEQAQLTEALDNVDGEIRAAQEAHPHADEDIQAVIAALQADVQAARASLQAARDERTRAQVAYAAAEREHAAAGRDSQRLGEDKRGLQSRLAELAAQRAAREREIRAQQQAVAAAQSELAAAQSELLAVEDQAAQAERARQDAHARERAATSEAETLQTDIEAVRESAHKAELQCQRVKGELDNLCGRIFDDYEMTYALAEPFRVSKLPVQETAQRIDAIKAEIRGMGAVNVGAVEEHRRVSQRFAEMGAQRDDLLAAQEDLRKVIADLTKKMEHRFREEFGKLNDYFSQTFTRLFGGGRAELRLQDEEDVLGCGIDIVAQPPGKKLQLLSLLSGGERALTAIAILFAMLRLKPTPFCILDEIEAALDEANIASFADFLAEFSRDTQFIIVTHRKGTMERCDALYGIAMEEKGVSRMVSVSLN